MNENFDVYICNSSLDKALAGDLRQYLINNGLHPFMAPCDVPVGSIYAEAVMQAISKCPVFIIIVSEASCKSMRVLNEIYEAARTRTRFIPFRIDDTSIPARMRYYLQAFECINGTIEPREQFATLFQVILSNLPVSRREEVVSSPKLQQKEETPVLPHSNNRIFVSYSRRDKEKVYPLVKKIEHALGVPCWIDTSGIMSSDRFIGVIRKAIDASEIVLYMYSYNAAKSSWTMKEINYAHSKGKRIVPIVLEGNSMRGDSAFMFADVNFVPISQEGQEAKLIADLAAMLGIMKEMEQPTNNPPKKGELISPPALQIVPPSQQVQSGPTIEFKANFNEGPNSIGGKIIITDTQLIFRAHSLNFGDLRDRVFEIRDIVSYKKGILTFMYISFSDGKTIKLSVWHKRRVINELESRRKSLI